MTTLIRYDAARAALAAAKSVDEIKEIHNRAEAMRAYGKVAQNREMEIDAAEIRVRAERRLGEMITETKSAGGLSVGGRPEKQPSKTKQKFTLREAGIGHKLSMRAQQTAKIGETKFEGLVAGWRKNALADDHVRISPALVIKAPKTFTPVPRPEATFSVAKGDIRGWSIGQLKRTPRLKALHPVDGPPEYEPPHGARRGA